MKERSDNEREMTTEERRDGERERRQKDGTKNEDA